MCDRVTPGKGNCCKMFVGKANEGSHYIVKVVMFYLLNREVIMVADEHFCHPVDCHCKMWLGFSEWY